MMETYNDIYAPITAEEMANIPEEMKKEPRWICWGSDKVPVSICSAQNGNHYGIDVTKPENWGTFTQAAAAIGQPAYVKYLDQNFHIVGIGFVVGDGWFCADLDGGAGHKKEDVPEDPITSAVIKMHPYFEKSLSGCGYHIFGKCDFDSAKAESNKPHRNQDGNPVPESYEIEFFTRRKFIAITGRIVETKKYCSNKHINTGFDGIFGARSFYEEWILNDFQRDEEKRAEERAKVTRYIPINTDDAAQMFLLNYPEILAASDSSNFKRGGPGVKLAPGEYSWIAAVKAMQEIGIPEADIIDWCRRGNNFKSEKDVQKVLDKPGKPGAASVAGIIADAKANGWKPDPAKLTGEAKRNHEQKLYEEEQLRKFREEHHEEHAAALAAVGIDCAGDPYRYTWTLDFDGSIDTVTEQETGEIKYQKTEEERAAARAAGNSMLPGNVYLADPAAAAPAETPTDPATPWETIEKAAALPVFPMERFPGWIQDHICAFAASTGVNKDYCAAAVLGTISAVTVGHCDILFNGTHREPVQLYTAFVGGSGTMKSSVIRHFMEPATNWLRANNEQTKKTNFAIKKQIEDLEKKIATEKKAGDKANQETILDYTALIEQKREERHNGFPVPWDDVTPESLVNSMRYTRGTANIATAEGNIINVIVGRSYTQRGAVQNIDAFLKGADGEPIHLFRITTGETDIQRADISMLLGIQPDLLERLCTSADAVGRGLAQRFLIYAPEESENAIDYTAPVYMDSAHMAAWKDHIEFIASRFMDPDSQAKMMKLEPEADRIIRKFWNYERELKAERGKADSESIIGWISKLHGKALRVSAIMALLRDKEATEITAYDAENAVGLFKEYYIPQFIGAYEKPCFLTREQRQIIDWIVRRANRSGKRDYFAEHEAHKDLRQRAAFSGKDGLTRFRAALDDLREKNYIRPILIPPTGNAKRPTKAWQINPDVFTN